MIYDLFAVVLRLPGKAFSEFFMGFRVSAHVLITKIDSKGNGFIDFYELLGVDLKLNIKLLFT